MRSNILLSGLLAVTMLGGCTSGYYVVGDVPVLRQEVVVERPGFVWAHGNWANVNRQWVWRGGTYERERPNSIYVQSHWDRRGNNHVWVNGGWRAKS